MAGSRKSPPGSALPAQVSAVLRQYVQRGARVVAGLSGGVDSVVLLDLLARAARKLRFELVALHVNHQINPNAGRWAAFCRTLCRQRGIPLKVLRVTVERGGSLEARARAARYRAFAAQRADCIALAHNLDDQAETVLLQLLRGAGVKGVSAMPVLRQAAPHAAILRPLLDIPRRDIEAYARRRKLAWVEDGSNADLELDRNYVRHRVLPAIAERYPSYRTTLARASRNFGESAQLLDDLAAADAEFTREGLGIDSLATLSAARAKNVLRYFLARHGVPMPNAARLDECVRQLQLRRTARIVIEIGAHELRRHGDELRIVAKTAALPRTFRREWRGEASLALPELGGALELKRCRGRGISLARLNAQPVSVRLRQGGERLRPHAQRPRRSLKNLLQEARMPPWQRARLPLLFCGNTLVYVPGIGIDAAFCATAGESAVEPRWICG